MRAKGTPASLGEIMGGADQGGTLRLKDLPDILGADKVQDMPRNRIGRYRLMRALQQRFGNGYRNIPGVKGLIEEFDEDTKFNQVLEKVRAIKPKGKKNG